MIPAIQKFSEAMTQAEMFKQRLPYEKRIRRIFAKRFKLQSTAVQAELQREKYTVQESVSSLQALLLTLLDVPDEEWTSNIASTLADAIVKAGKTQFADMMPMPAASFTFDMAALSRELNQYAGKLIRGIDETTRKRVVEILTEGANQGLSYSQIASNLRREFRQFSTPSPQRHITDRATLIAVTEIGNAYIRGQVDAAEQMIASGIALEKSWLTVGDDRVSDGCRVNESESWIPFDQAFLSGHPHPLRFPGCRCSLLIRAVS